MSKCGIIYGNSKATRLSEKLIEEINVGQYQPGQLLPAESQLAVHYNVSRRTIRKALDILAENDHLIKHPQRGVLVPSESTSKVRHQKACLNFVSVASMGGEYDDYRKRIFWSINEAASEKGFQVQSIFLKSPDDVKKLTPENDSGFVFAVSSSAHIDLIPLGKLASAPKIFLINYSGEVSVHSDHYQGIHLAIDHLYQLGHRRIALLIGPLKDQACQNRFEAYCQEMQKYGLTIEPNWLVYNPSYEIANPECQEKIFNQLFLKDHEPTAVIGTGYYLTAGLLCAMNRHHISVPGEISLVGYDDPSGALYTNPPLTTIRQNLTLIGASIVDLFEKMKKGETVESEVLPVELIVRDSTASVSIPKNVS